MAGLRVVVVDMVRPGCLRFTRFTPQACSTTFLTTCSTLSHCLPRPRNPYPILPISFKLVGQLSTPMWLAEVRSPRDPKRTLASSHRPFAWSAYSIPASPPKQGIPKTRWTRMKLIQIKPHSIVLSASTPLSFVPVHRVHSLKHSSLRSTLCIHLSSPLKSHVCHRSSSRQEEAHFRLWYPMPVR